MSDSGLEVGRDEVSHNLRGSYERVPSENERSPSIFRVSPALLKECEDAYVPQIVSIGPYHEGKEHLRGMDRFKEEATRRASARILIKAGCAGSSIDFEMENLFRRMERKIYEIERCYEKQAYFHGLDSRSMVLDACFILEFFRCLFDESVDDFENLEKFCPEFGSNFNPVVRWQIMKDLIKLDNQIPLFVLEEIVSMEMGGDLQKGKSSLQLLLKAVFHKFYYRPFDYVASGESLRRNHILEVYYYYCLGDEEPQEERQKVEEPHDENQKAEELWIFLGSYVEDLEKHQSERLDKVPSAVQLEKGGVKIQATGKTVQDIRFEGRTLYFPPVELDSDSEIFIRNLMALEIYYPYGSLRRMTALVRFMNELCLTEEGTAVMREKGVIVGNLRQDSEVTRLFSSSTQSHSVPSCYSIEVTRKKLMQYYSRKSRIAAAEAWNEFRKTYFSKPWFLVGGIGATIILILTAVQVICLFHSCGAH